jgi:hypothetical protein
MDSRRFRPLDDQVHLVPATLGAQVLHLGLRRLGIPPYGERDQSFEQRAEHGTVPRDMGGALAPFHQRVDADAEQAGRESRIGKLMLRSGAHAASGPLSALHLVHRQRYIWSTVRLS